MLAKLFSGSLTRRLSLLFAIVTFAVMASIGTYLYRAVDYELAQRDEAELIGKIDFVRHLLSETVSFAEIINHPHRWTDIKIGHPRLHLTLLDDRENVLVTISQLSLPREQWFIPFAVNETPSTIRYWETTDGKQFRTVAAWGSLSGAQPQQALILLALDTSERRALLGKYLRSLVVAVFAGGLAAALLGYWISRRGLRPVHQIAATAGAISPHHLDRRLAMENVPEEMRELVVSFNKMLDHLQESFTRLSQFSSDLAHELRTPINNLLGHTQVTLAQTRTDDEYRHVLESNVEEYERLSRMIHDMLFLAKADNAQATLKMEQLDLRQELDRVVEFYEAVAQEHGVAVACEGNVVVAADRILLQRAISNLLSNALRQTPRGGTIRIELIARGDAVELSIDNPGPGIPAKHLPRVFDRFYRIDTSREKSAESSGLGLAIVKSIMELHGGSANVRSIPGQITTFTLRFLRFRGKDRSQDLDTFAPADESVSPTTACAVMKK